MVTIATFGGLSDKEQHLQRGTVYVDTEAKRRVPINVLVVHMIARETSNLNLPSLSTLPHLRDLK